MIVSVLFLIGLFLCISAYLILTGLNFIGLSYLLVYVGAVIVRMDKFAALVRIQLYKVLLAWWYNVRSPFLPYEKNKYRDFSSLTLKNLLKTKPKPILGARSYSTITPGNSLNNISPSPYFFFIYCDIWKKKVKACGGGGGGFDKYSMFKMFISHNY